MKKLTAAALLATIGTWIVAAFPAHAAPTGTKIAAVYQTPCSGASCDGDTPLADGAAVVNTIEIRVESNSSVGLDWIRLDARLGTSGDWTCIQQWTLGGATSVSREYRWGTKFWPNPDSSSYDCPSSLPSGVVESSGVRTANGAYDLRAVAKERVSGSTQTSAVFVVKANNLPTAPTWAGDPAGLRDGTNRPFVELKWNASPEPDIVEYHFVREGPAGSVEYWVSATSPGGQGCSKSGSVYTCYDDDFPTKGYGGDYSYEIYAFRSSPVSTGSCSSGGKCVASAASSTQTTSLDEPTPSPSPSNGGSPSPSKTPGGTGGGSGGGGGSTPSPSATGRSPSRVLGGSVDNSEFFTGDYEGTLPYDDQPGFGVLPGSDSSGSGTPGSGLIDETLAGDAGDQTMLQDLFDDRRIMVSIAAGMLMVLVAMHVVRLLFDR